MSEMLESNAQRVLAETRIDRRMLLRRAVALGLSAPVLAVLLAACGDDDDDDPTATPADTGQQPDPTPTEAAMDPTPTEEDDDDGDDDEPTPTEAAMDPTPTEEDDDDDEPTPTEDDDDDLSIRITGPFPGEAGQLNGAGATFPAVLYSRWFFEYENVTGVQVNYQSIGSGGGIRSVIDKTVDFGGTDGPMSDEQKEDAGGTVFHLPMALGAVVPTYNIPDFDDDAEPLNFTPETLAGIYLGEITTWNDPLLVADNPQLADIDRNILVVHRSDGSGTTFIFVDYLSAVSETWRENVGVGTSVNWPVGLGGNGNEGVAGEVNQNPYSIGYVELIYAKQNELGIGNVRNKAGNFIEPTTETVTAAADGVSETIQEDLAARIVDADGEDSYPITGFTWILAYEDQEDEARAIALTRMLWWCLTDAQAFNGDLGYAPIPASIVVKALAMVRGIKLNGESVFPGE